MTRDQYERHAARTRHARARRLHAALPLVELKRRKSSAIAVSGGRPLSDEHLRAIGSVISQWGRTEHSLFVATSAVFARTPGNGKQTLEPGSVLPMLMASGMTPRIMIGLLKGLFGFVFPKEESEIFNKIANRLLKCEKSRNAIAHATWREGKRPGSLTTLTIHAVGEVKFDQPEFTIAEMETLTQRIKSARLDLIRFIRRHGYYSCQDKEHKEADE